MEVALDNPADSSQDASLVQAARAARLQAWCPYSGFQVGCAILDGQGRIHAGANVENASYGLTVCAERSAFFTAVGAGARKIKRVVIVTRYRVAFHGGFIAECFQLQSTPKMKAPRRSGVLMG